MANNKPSEQVCGVVIRKGCNVKQLIDQFEEAVRPWLIAIIETAELIIDLPDYIVRDVPISLPSVHSHWIKKSLVLGWNTLRVLKRLTTSEQHDMDHWWEYLNRLPVWVIAEMIPGLGASFDPFLLCC
jgi:hypothetical protein